MRAKAFSNVFLFVYLLLIHSLILKAKVRFLHFLDS